MNRLATLEEEIGRALEQAAAELRAAPSYGRPLALPEGWDEAPPELRMAFKLLKDGGFVPPEVALFHERARLRAALASAREASQRTRLEAELAALEQRLALRLEALRTHALL
ncbi:MAG: DUF1992 domain-containing protein [Casimicrobiaceae bacterium]|nr:DUF1992 domain-containing protein [Casimicrobiaceae bacterium]MCX8098133.1 DUF1992 domain-containing protein [Casimicrobiaceae bacterium]MDW8311671.1 DUF1992 domain-containing protein [Burkholderiales bacterium]